MDHILHSNHYAKAELRKLNYCRLYLGLITLSDVTTTDGLNMDEHMLQGRTSEQSS